MRFQKYDMVRAHISVVKDMLIKDPKLYDFYKRYGFAYVYGTGGSSVALVSDKHASDFKVVCNEKELKFVHEDVGSISQAKINIE